MPQTAMFPGQALAMTGQAADRLLKLDSGDAALLYLHLLRRGGLEGLGWPEGRLAGALEQLRTLGLAPNAPPPPAAVAPPPPPPPPPPTTPRRTSAGRWRTRAPPSPRWRTRWSASWAKSSPPRT